MDLEKIAEASHQAWFVAMAKQGWIFGPRLNPDFKTHPWLKPYGGLSDTTKEIVRAQVRGTLAALEAHGMAPKGSGSITSEPRPSAPAPAAQPLVAAAARTVPATPEPARPAAAPEARPAPVASAPRPSAPSSNDAAVIEVLDRKIDASGRMRIGSGLVKKAELLPNNGTQVAILQKGNEIEVLPYDADLKDAFFASVNPDGFMLPKAMLSGMGAVDFVLTIAAGRLLVKPK